MAEQGPLSIDVTLNTNAQQAAQQVDQFNLALGRVNQQARNIFASLQELSQRYQQQGFLGMGDQRTLEQGLRQWERTAQVLELRRRGAQGRLELAQTMTDEGAGLRITQAQGVLKRLTEHQAGRTTLQGSLGNLYGGLPPGMTNAWTPPAGLTPLQQAHAALQLNQQRQGAATTAAAQARLQQVQLSAIAGGIVTGAIPPGPRQLTALQAAHLVEQQNVARAAHFSQMQTGAAAMAQLPLTQRNAIANAMLANLTPLQQAHMAQFGMPTTPLQQAHASLVSQQQGQQHQGLQQAQLVSLMAQMGPQGARVFQPGRLSEMAMQGGANLVGAIQRPARLVLGAAAGIGVYQTLTESMDLYRQRAQGIIDVGMRLDLNFAQVGHTIDTLRTKYQVLAHDSIAAQVAMTRILGGAGGLDPAVRAGAAYGVAAPQAAALAGTLSRLTQPGSAPLSTIAAIAGQTRPGITPMAVEELWEETTRIAGAGGAAAARVGVAMPADWMSFITSMGERYNVPGAASGFFGRFAAGVNQSPDATTQALRIRAIRTLAGHRGPMLRIGEEDFDLRTITGQRMAMENAIDSPEILEAYRQMSGEMFGADPEQHELGFQALVGTGLSLTESRRVRREAERRRGFGGMGHSATGVTRAQEELETARLAERGGAPEFQIAITQAMKEAGLERLGEPLVNASNQLKQVLINLTDQFRDGTISLGAIQQTFQSLDNTTKILLGAGGLLGSQGMLGQMLGGLMLVQGLTGAPQTPGVDPPVPVGPFQSVPARTGPSLLPQR